MGCGGSAGNSPTELVEHIICYIKPLKGSMEKDKLCWVLYSRGSFTIKSTWNCILHKEDLNIIHKRIWTKWIPFKIAFMMWRLWKFKISVDDRLRRWGLEGLWRYWCCDKPDQEILAHVFIRSEIANIHFSNYFASRENFKVLIFEECKL